MVRSLAAEGLLRSDHATIEATTAELPDSLRELVVRRLRDLPEATIELLRVTAVLGDTASVQDLAAVSHRSATEVGDQLSEAFRGGLLGALGDAVVFRHQLVHDAIYRDIPGPVRRALHREIAGALAGAGADPLQVADHLVFGAGRGDLEAVGWLRRAARDAAAGAPTVSVELLRRAESLLPGGHLDADVLAAELVDALLRAGNVAEAAARAEAVLDRRHRDDADLPLRLSLMTALSLQNRAAELIEHADAALGGGLGGGGSDVGGGRPELPVAVTALMLTHASYGQTSSGDVIGGEATARRALDVAERAGSRTITAWSLTTLSIAVKSQGRYAEAVALTDRAVGLAAGRPGRITHLRHPLFFHATTLAASDRFNDARRAYAAALRAYVEHDSPWLTPDTLLMSAAMRFQVGDWDDAAPELEAGLHAAREDANQTLVSQALAYQAVMAVARGDDHEAEVDLAPAMPALERSTPGFGSELVAFAAALLAESRDDPATSYTLLGRVWDHDLERDNRYYHRDLAPTLVRLAMKLGDGDAARRVADAVEAGAELAPEVPSVQSAAHRCRGLAAQDADRLVEAVRFARRSPRLLDHAGACEDAADALIMAGRADEARPLLDEAMERYEHIGALAWAARTRAALRRVGVRGGSRGPRRRPEHGWASLTDTQRTVSQLVTEGLTNREIAKRLYISPHTVNTHLRHVFEKLSVANRAELAATVTRSSGEARVKVHSNE
jgi:DNA-binding CsgD family transcriptional regulator